MTAKLINQSTVICCTLSSAGRDDFSLLTHGFESILIDEAAQAVELSTLIPLKYDVKRCILVGDPAQLPATVLSKEAADCLVSLFRCFSLHALSVSQLVLSSTNKAFSSG